MVVQSLLKPADGGKHIPESNKGCSSRGGTTTSRAWTMEIQSTAAKFSVGVVSRYSPLPSLASLLHVN